MKEKYINPHYPDFWNQKYKNNDIGWDIGSSTPIFVDWSKTISGKKNILIPGAGRGHDALYLSKKKHNIYAVDFSIEAINFLEIKAKELNLEINTICEDFFQLRDYYGQMDIILEYTFFCAINPQLRLKYIKETFKLLKEDGLFIAIILPINKDVGEPGPPYGVNLQETLDDFSYYYDILECKESALSIYPRIGNEVFTIMKKKCKK